MPLCSPGWRDFREVEAMAWGGKIKTRMGVKERGYFLRHTHRRLPTPDLPDPRGVPRSVMKTLAQENLSADPIAFNARLQQLLRDYHKNGG